VNSFLPVKAVPMPGGLKIDPRIGPLHMTESVILGSGLHRVKFEQFGRVPDLEPILAKHTPQDGRYVFCMAWMDQQGTGHIYLAWNENQPVSALHSADMADGG
jgi:hypothetical protein